MSKPVVCLIDENPLVQVGWEKSLESNASLAYYRDHLELFKDAENKPNLISSFSCIITGKNFSHLQFDIVNSDVCEQLRKKSTGPIFLNWQGYISKDYLEKNFDGKIFHRYGVKWHTLRLRIQKLDKKKIVIKPQVQPSAPTKKITKDQKCFELLKSMADRAEGEHKKKIEFYAFKDPSTGIKLLEAIYTSLLTNKDRSFSCPSRYINSSPVIAAKILHDTLQ